MSIRALFMTFFLLLITQGVRADIFEFSYKFTGTNDVISGYFSGTAHGDLITNLSDITLYLNGSAIPTDKSGYMYSIYLQNGVYQPGGQLSFDGLQNNIAIVDIPNAYSSAIPNVDFISGYTANLGNYIEFAKNANFGGIETTIYYKINSTVTSSGNPEFNTADWSIISAMPIPSSFWLFGSVLAGFGFFKTVKRKFL